MVADRVLGGCASVSTCSAGFWCTASWKGSRCSLERGGKTVVENSAGGGDPVYGGAVVSVAEGSMAARVQERLISAYVPQRLRIACGVSQRHSQPMVTRCLRAALILRWSMRKTSAIHEALHQPPLMQRCSR